MADHQNKPDLAVSIVHQWIDRDTVDMICGVDSSAVALACSVVLHDKDKAHLNTGAGTSALTGKACNANTIHQGGDTWFFITADYTSVRSHHQQDATGFIEAAGGKVLGAVFFPFPDTTTSPPI